MELSVLGLSFSYNSHPVVEDISFILKEGEMLCVLGVNGAGKSTLLKCITRILNPTHGKVYLNKKDILSMKRYELARRVAYVPQNPPVSGLTVFETVLLGRRPHFSWKLSRRDVEIVNKVIKELSLEHLSLTPVNNLSGGERQKVVIARALAQEPEILILDEPTSSLDLKNQIEIMSLIKWIVINKKVSAIVAIHDLNLALRFGDKFLFLKDKRVFHMAETKDCITEDIIKQVYGIDVVVTNIKQNMVVIPI